MPQYSLYVDLVKIIVVICNSAPVAYRDVAGFGTKIVSLNIL
jgi:hypothetical protein